MKIDPTPAEDRARSIDAQIVDALRAASRPLTQREIAQRLSMTGDGSSLWRPLRRLLDKAAIVHIHGARYEAASCSRIVRHGRTTMSSDDPAAAKRFLAVMHREYERLQRDRRARRLAAERRASAGVGR